MNVCGFMKLYSFRNRCIELILDLQWYIFFFHLTNPILQISTADKTKRETKPNIAGNCLSCLSSLNNLFCRSYLLCLC